ncbi:L-2,4-diaminobutyric acid acetyltransferase [compost metagenome]
MLREILEREQNKHIRYVEATISPDNTASQRLFLSLAEECGCTFAITEKYGLSLFPEGMNHDLELLYRIGPIRKSTGIRVVN